MSDRRLRHIDDTILFAEEFVSMHPNGGVFGLIGPLGVGKTTFVRAVAHAIAEKASVVTPRVQSPSFVIHQSYELGANDLHHFDLYRFEAASHAELLELGYFDALEKREGRTLWAFIEWPEKAAHREELRLEQQITLAFEKHERLLKIESIKG